MTLFDISTVVPDLIPTFAVSATCALAEENSNRLDVRKTRLTLQYICLQIPEGSRISAVRFFFIVDIYKDKEIAVRVESLSTLLVIIEILIDYFS